MKSNFSKKESIRRLASYFEARGLSPRDAKQKAEHEYRMQRDDRFGVESLISGLTAIAARKKL